MSLVTGLFFQVLFLNQRWSQLLIIINIFIWYLHVFTQQAISNTGAKHNKQCTINHICTAFFIQGVQSETKIRNSIVLPFED